MPQPTHSLLVTQPGMSVIIRNLDGLDSLHKQRLADLGIKEGSDISIKRFCLFGGPIVLEYSGQLLCIRKKAAAQIEVVAT